MIALLAAGTEKGPVGWELLAFALFFGLLWYATKDITDDD